MIGPSRIKVAVMQPYFFPYAGYFRLMASCDRFVILDSVQFPRRGRVHRCEVPGPGGVAEWLTLPLARQPRDTCIQDLTFAADAPTEMARRLARHAWIAGARGAAAASLRRVLQVPDPAIPVADYLEAQLRLTAQTLGYATEILRGSSFDIPSDLRGQDRIIALARAAGGDAYLNSPGGRALYDPRAFDRVGLTLAFLPPWQGDHTSILPQLLGDDTQPLRAAILAQSRPEPVLGA